MVCAGLKGALPDTIDMTALTVLHATNTSMCFVANCSNPGNRHALPLPCSHRAAEHVHINSVAGNALACQAAGASHADPCLDAPSLCSALDNLCLHKMLYVSLGIYVTSQLSILLLSAKLVSDAALPA